MSLAITDLKKGTIFQLDGVPFKVVDYGQKVMGRGGSIVNVRIKSLVDGKVLDKTFKGNEQLDTAEIAKITAQYLYEDGQNFYFMDNANFNQFSITSDDVGDQRNYIKEGDQVQVQFFNDQAIAIELPKNVPLKVIYTEDVVKGDTATNILKDATLETNVVIKVPPFIKQGDVIKVDTRTGAYLEREK
jgi:elongation factor P